MGRATTAFAMGSFGKIEEMDFVVGEVEESAVRTVKMGLGEHQPWELRREMIGGSGDRGSPALADASESEIVSVGCEVSGD